MTFTRIETILREEMGLNTSSIGSSTLRNAMNRRMRAAGIETEHQYCALLRRSRREMNALIDEVAVNETWFFRDETPYTVLGQYAAAHHGRPLRLLSIPCATGEEPYSMAITLLESGLAPNDFRIDAVDISARSLSIARRAVYRERSFRNTTRPLRKIYFQKTPDGHLLDPRIRRTVRFHKGNLVHLTPALAAAVYDVIFCRNLLIYIDQGFHHQAIATLEHLLTTDGLLFVGHAESGIFADTCFVPTRDHRAFCFRKAPRPKGLPVAGTSRMPEPPPPHLSQEDSAAAHIEQLYRKGRYGAVIEAAEKELSQGRQTPRIYYLFGAALLQTDQRRDAARMLKRAVYLDPDDVNALRLLSRVHDELGDHRSQELYQRRAERVRRRLEKRPHAGGEETWTR